MSDEGVESLFARASALNQARRPHDAISLVKDAMSMAPEDYRGPCIWSTSLYLQGKFAESAEMARRAIYLAPNESRGFCLLSTALRAQARAHSRKSSPLGASAVEAAREAVRLAPNSAANHGALAQSLPLTGDFSGADAEIREVLRLAPDESSSWVAASFVALQARDWSTAIDASRRALAMEPDNSAALNNLGVALRASGKRSEGIRTLAESARVDPSGSTARRNLSSAGLNIVRVTVLIILIPIGLLAHVGFGLYFLFAVGFQILLSRYPNIYLRVEKWAAPIALFASRFGKRHEKATEATSTSSPVISARSETVAQWTTSGARHRIRTSIVLLMAVSSYIAAACFVLIAFLTTGTGMGSSLLTAAVFLLLAATLTRVVRKRSGRNRR